MAGGPHPGQTPPAATGLLSLTWEAHPSIGTGQHRHCCKEIDPRAFPGATWHRHAQDVGVSRRLGRIALGHRPPVTRAAASSPVRSREIKVTCSHGIFKSPSQINTHPQTVWETARLAPQRCLPWFLFGEPRDFNQWDVSLLLQNVIKGKKINLN